MNSQQAMLWSAFGCPCRICRERRKIDADHLDKSAVASSNQPMQNFPNNVFLAMAGHAPSAIDDQPGDRT